MSDYDSGIKRLKSSIEELGLPEAEFKPQLVKPRPSLLPVEWTEMMLVVQEAGAKKHGKNDWRENPRSFVDIMDGLERHIIQFKKKEDIDPDDGLRTIVKVAVRALYLAYYQLKGIGNDDR